MGWTRWAFVAFSAAIAVAVSGPMGVAGCVTCKGGPAAGLGAPACRGPMFGTEPGCCEHPATPCDNAWAGFCQEKLKWNQFWHQVGTGHRVPPRARAPARTWTPGLRPPLVQAIGFSPASSQAIHPAGEPGPIRLPPIEEAWPNGPKEPVLERGPPPLPEPNDVLDLPPETDAPAPAPPGQARLIWQFSG